MLATTVDGTMETSSFRGGHARARTEEIASSCYSGLALMHAPVSHQQENASALQETVGKKHFASPYTPFQHPPFASHAFR